MGFLQPPANTCCPSTSITSVVPGPPGPAGADGAAGAAGTNGSNAYTLTTAGYNQPAVGANVTVSVADSAWMSVGQVIFVQSGGYYTCTSKPDGTSVILNNLGYAGNAAPAAAVANTREVSPGGLIGTTGVAGPTYVMDDLSPTTTKGDIIADDGGSTPAASTLRVAVGTDGQALVANSVNASGLGYSTITPNTATDNMIARFNGATGTPVPLQTSYLIITDTGAIQGTTGNARGTSATDLQVTRTAATEVASGNYSTIAGGRNNVSSGADSAVLGGNGNASSGQYGAIGGGVLNVASDIGATVAGGSSNTASADYAAVGGGGTNTASGNYSVVAGGNNSIASGANSFIGAGDGNTAKNTYACVVSGYLNDADAVNACILNGVSNDVTGTFGCILTGQAVEVTRYAEVAWGHYYTAVGDAQASTAVMSAKTTDATQTEMFLNGVTASQRFGVPQSHALTFQITVIARRDNNDCAAWKSEGAIKNNAGTTALIGSVTTSLIAADAGCSGTWGVAGNVVVDADNGNDALRIRVTGAGGNTIQWVARLDVVEVEL